jgi:hypothetical protein
MQTAVVAVVVLLSVAVLGRKLWQAIKRRCGSKSGKNAGCGKCSGCG